MSTGAAPLPSNLCDDIVPLTFRPLGIDTWQEHVVYLHRDCAVCRAEGFSAQARVTVRIGHRSLIATVNTVEASLLSTEEVSLSRSASDHLQARAGDAVWVSHAPSLESLRDVRSKIFGHRLEQAQLASIVTDVAAERYSDVHIAAFLTACANGRMSLRETADLTRAMVDAGETLHWATPVVADKHCVGGLPGNRTSPIVVAIAAATGLLVPKTSSRAITSPAGTADTMAVLTRVALDARELRRVVERTGAALAWGGALSLSPADDLMIRVERALALDSDAQMVASILSKKIAAGSTHVLIDVPIGPTAKVRSLHDLARLRAMLEHVGAAFGLHLSIVQSDGTQPIGRGIGPALEARDVLEVLQCASQAPVDLRDRSITLAGALLELCNACQAGEGLARAERVLSSGAAWQKFQAICEAQGGLRSPGEAVFRHDILADRSGQVREIDCRRIARAARLAGAPEHPEAGIQMKVRLGDTVTARQILFTLHAQASGELAYAAAFAAEHPAIRIDAD
jgi:thymidine phosphorylase